MKRHRWVERLWETIEAHRLLPFRWAGRADAHDCCSFVAACLDAMTEGSYLDELLSNYSDEASALAYIERCGGLEATLTSHLGEPKPLGFMGRGDVALVVRADREFVGICIGDTIVSAGPEGLVTNSREFAVRAWGTWS
jgi:hypothetical protein